jgi:signal transduction histidine kinase
MKSRIKRPLARVLTSVMRDTPLAMRMVTLFALLVAAIAVFMIVFFPARMEIQARRSANQRAIAIATVMATAAGPALEFDDEENASQLLRWLEASPEAAYAVLRRSDGSALATWHAERAPARRLVLAPPSSDDEAARPVTQLRPDVLDVAAPVRGLGGASGSLEAGFSLATLSADKATARRTVVLATVAVLAIGLFVCVLLASILVKPIREVTAAARRIASGDSPPSLDLSGQGRDEVGQMAVALDRMLNQLQDANRKVVDASRQAGMAEVATGVLHNVGNVLNSVNVSVSLLGERIRGSQIPRVRKGVDILESVLDSGTEDERRPHLVPYFAALATHLEEDRAAMQAELDGITKSVEHVKQIVSIQNAHARPAGVYEIAELDSIIEEAVTLDRDSLHKHRIDIAVEIPPLPRAKLDRHAIMQILVNLVTNAKDALKDRADDRRLRLTVTRDEAADTVQIAVADNGTGIPVENLAKIFGSGFTTKPTGHGFGLHSSALAARVMGGSLTAHSDGPGCGAVFTLTLPFGEIKKN